MKHLYGITVAMITPMNEKGEIRLEEMAALTRHLIDKDVSCLYPNGTTGEMFLLSVEERKAVAETVVKEANGEVPVFIHVGAMNQADTMTLARHALECGADGVGVVTPAFFNVRSDELEAYYVEIANDLPEDFPVYLYNIPQRSTNDLTLDVCKTVVRKTRNVIGVKYSYLDLDRVVAYGTVNNGQWRVMHGADSYLLQLLQLGCDGVISGVANCYPEPFLRAYKAYQAGKLDEAMEHMKAARRVAKILKNGMDMAYFKAAVEYRTEIKAGGMRKPLRSLTLSDLSNLHQDLDAFENDYELG